MRELKDIDIESLKDFLNQNGPIEYDVRSQLRPQEREGVGFNCFHEWFKVAHTESGWRTGPIVCDYAAISIALSWIEAEIMGVEGYRCHEIGKGIDEIWTVTLVTKEDGEIIMSPYQGKTKLTALIETYKELTK